MFENDPNIIHGENATNNILTSDGSIRMQNVQVFDSH